MARQQYAGSQGVAGADRSLDLPNRQFHGALNENSFVLHGGNRAFRTVKHDRATHPEFANRPRQILRLAHRHCPGWLLP